MKMQIRPLSELLQEAARARRAGQHELAKALTDRAKKLYPNETEEMKI